MKNKKINILTLTVLSLSTLLTGCGNLNKVSSDGFIEGKEIIFPKIEKSTFKHSGTQQGSWVELENIHKVEQGMNKAQLYNLLGTPHHREGFYTREWDYTFNFRINNQFKQCQFKILFDNNMDAKSFHWLPVDCLKAENKVFDLSADVLFDFDSSVLTEEGKREVSNIALKLRQQQATSITVKGWTDRLGSDSYNLSLSQLRAEAVKTELLNNGLNISIKAQGKGKLDLVACHNEDYEELKQCLKPNRKVEVLVND